MSSIFARSVLSISLVLVGSACAPDDGGSAASLRTAPLGEDGSPDASTGDADARETAAAPGASGPASTSVSSDVARLGAGNRAFAFALFRAVAADRAGENLVLSPYGVSSSLAMVFAGARRRTEAEMGATLRFDLPQPALHAAFAEVARQLSARVEAGAGITLKLGSNVWIREDLAVVPDFAELLRTRYGSAPQPADFAGDPGRALAAINAQVAARTDAKIGTLLAPGDVSEATELVLTSAAYLGGPWQLPLAEGAPAEFTDLAGASREVPTVQASGALERARGERWDAVALPFAGRALRLVAVLPDAGAYQEVEGEASADWFDALRAALKPELLTVTVPRFAARARTPLRGALESLDLGSLFRGGDLTGIAEEGVLLDDVIHEAALEVTRDGAQAVSETGVGAGEAGETVRFDRPFLYAIVDEPTGQILFLGRVLQPGG